jgi:hypothetical protein
MGRASPLGPKPRDSLRAFPSDVAGHPGLDVDPDVLHPVGLLSGDLLARTGLWSR